MSSTGKACGMTIRQAFQQYFRRRAGSFIEILAAAETSVWVFHVKKPVVSSLAVTFRQIMDIVIIGAGNVAHCFSHQLQLHGHQIRQVVSRNIGHARSLAEQLNASSSDDLMDIDMSADVYLLAVQDDAIAEVNRELRLGKRMVAHTSGAVPMDAICNISVNIGVVYPLQSFRKELRNMQGAPVLLEASNELTLRRLRALAEGLTNRVVVMDSAQRLKMHLAAVLCNNFVNHLVTRCKDYCERESLDFDLLQPLLLETFQRLERSDPRSVQTGPAFRKDAGTQELHRAQLLGYPGLLQLYNLFSSDIEAFYSDQAADASA